MHVFIITKHHACIGCTDGWVAACMDDMVDACMGGLTYDACVDGVVF
jgi:hypothetical protein